MFFFVNGEYEDNVTAGPKSTCTSGDSDDWGPNTANVNRPTVGKMDEIRNYFINEYGYDPDSIKDILSKLLLIKDYGTFGLEYK